MTGALKYFEADKQAEVAIDFVTLHNLYFIPLDLYVDA